MPKFREITGQFVGYIPDSIDSDIVPDRAPMNGRVTFTPVFTGGVIAFPELSPPEFAHPRTIHARIVDGFVKVEVNEGEGDDEQIVLQPLTLMVTVDDEASQVWSWRAEFDEILLGGSDEYVKIPAWSFRVPDGTGPVDLTELVPLKSGGNVDVTKGPRGAGLENITAVDGQLVFAYTDGEEATIAIPEAVQGPEGPQGPAGADGAQGPEGPQGPAGEIPDLLVSNITDATPTGKNLMLAATEGAARNALGLAVGATATNGSLSELNNGVSNNPRVWTPRNIADYVESKNSRGVVYANPPSGDDDTAYLTSLFSAHSGKTIVLFPGSTYKVTDAVPISSDTIIEGSGSTIDATQIPQGTTLNQRRVFQVSGNIETARSVNAEVIKGTRNITGISNLENINVGDKLSLKNLDMAVEGFTRATRKGEIVEVGRVVSPTEIEITKPTLFGYSVNDTSISRINFNKNSVIRNLSIECGGKYSVHSGIVAEYASNLVLSNVRTFNTEDIAIYLNHSEHSVVRDCQVFRSDTPATTSVGTTGYGVCVSGHSRNIKIHDNYFENCRHFIAGGGANPPVYVEVKNNHGVGTDYGGYDCHEQCLYWTFDSNIAEDCRAVGFIIRGQYITVVNNIVKNSKNGIQAYAYSGVLEQHGIRIINNFVEDITFTGYQVGSTAEISEVIGCEVSGNRANRCSDGIVVDRASNLQIVNNTVENSKSTGINIRGISTEVMPLTDVYVSGNVVVACPVSGIVFKNSKTGNFNSNSLYNCGSTAISFETCEDVNISNTLINGFRFSGIKLVDSNRFSISMSKIIGATESASDCIYMSNSTGVQVNGGQFASGRAAVSTASCNFIAVVNIDGRECLASNKVVVAASDQIVKDNFL